MDLSSHEQADAPPYSPSSTYLSSSKKYALGGRIMLLSIVLLFVVVVLMLCLHVYARWRHLRRNRYRNRSSSEPSQHRAQPERVGLDPKLLESIPVFVFPSSRPTPCFPTDCSVCLCEFCAGEMGRTLPSCRHSFHVECIDMWLHSHTTCPICRCPVDLSSPPSEVITLPSHLRVSVAGGGGVVVASQLSPKSLPQPTVSTIRRILSRDARTTHQGGGGGSGIVGCPSSSSPSSSSSSSSSVVDLEKGEMDGTMPR